MTSTRRTRWSWTPTCVYSATAAEFVNIPLTNITVSVDSQIDGPTASVINCGGTNTGSTGANGDGSVTVNDLEPTAPGVMLDLHHRRRPVSRKQQAGGPGSSWASHQKSGKDGK